MLQVNDFNHYEKIIENNKAVLFYFSQDKCNVCKVLKPKIIELLTNKFPNIKAFYCDTANNPEIAAQNSIFTVPTILVYFAGKENLRKSRNIGISELEDKLQRPYEIIF